MIQPTTKHNSIHNEENKPPPSKYVTLLTPNNPPLKEHFDFDDDKFKDLCREFIPKITSMGTWKCMYVFEEWEKERDWHSTNDNVPDGVPLTDE